MLTSQTIIVLELIRIQTHNSALFLPVETQILQSSFKTCGPPHPSTTPTPPSPHPKEIRPNLPYSVSRGLKTGLAVPKASHIIRPNFSTVFKLFENDPFLNLLEKTRICSTGLETGWKPVLLFIDLPCWQNNYSWKKQDWFRPVSCLVQVCCESCFKVMKKIVKFYFSRETLWF